MHEIDLADLGKQVAWAREQRGITQYALARKIGIHPVTLSRIEHGKLPGMTATVLARLARELDLSIDELLRLRPGQWLHDAISHIYAAEEKR